MTFKVLNNIGALKKDQSIQGGFFLEFSNDKIMDSILFVVDFKVHTYYDAFICKYIIDSN
jgi:hypothetical protein